MMGMRYVAIAESDIGIAKDVNQDSILVKHATYGSDEILMAIICDGMGGLSKGEAASATVIREFDEWFSKALPFELNNIDMNVIGGKWSLLLKSLNIKIQEYGQKSGEKLGTTFTGILLINSQFVAVHVGDTRLYRIGSSLTQLTTDHTYVAREVLKGTITLEQAQTDKRRNMLLQCVGASKIIDPQIICAEAEQAVYMLCSDGFRHKITAEEIVEHLEFNRLETKRDMIENSRRLIKLIKQRGEKDNISVILIKSSPKKNQMKRNKWALVKRLLSKKIAYLLFSTLLLISVAILICGLLCI